MSFLPSLFRFTASRLRISDFAAQELALEKVTPIIKTDLVKQFTQAVD